MPCPGRGPAAYGRAARLIEEGRRAALAPINEALVPADLLDFPVPVLLLGAAGFVVGWRRLTSRDAVPVVAVGSLGALMFFYFHRDIFFGPRQLFSVTPWFGAAMVYPGAPVKMPMKPSVVAAEVATTR